LQPAPGTIIKECHLNKQGASALWRLPFDAFNRVIAVIDERRPAGAMLTSDA
jgi:hypothetical protein